MTENSRAEPAQAFHNHLKRVRLARGLSQGELASKAGITRQAISAIESDQYLPTTAVALRLASVLACRVEDLFSLAPAEDVIEGTFVGARLLERRTTPLRVKVAKVGAKTVTASAIAHLL